MALRGNLVGFMRSVMKINLNPFESQFSTGIMSTAPKSTPLSNPFKITKPVSSATMNSPLEVSNQLLSRPTPLSNHFETSKQVSSATMNNSPLNVSRQLSSTSLSNHFETSKQVSSATMNNSPLNVSRQLSSTPLSNSFETSKQVSSATMNSPLEVSKQLSSAPLNNPFEASKMFSPAPLIRVLETSKQFTDLGQAKYPDSNIPHQEKFDYDSGSDNNASENTGYKVGSLVGLMALFSTMVSPTEPMDKKTEQLVELLSQAHKEHERSNFTLAYKIYETANKFVEGKRQIKEFSDKECLNYRIFIHDNIAEMAYKQGYYWKAVGAYKAMMCDHEQLGLEKTDHAVVQTMIKLATVYALKKDGDNARIYYQFAIDAEEKRIAADADDKEALRLLRMATEALGRFLLHIGDYPEADRHLKRAIEVCREIYGEEHPRIYALIVQYAKVKIGQREFTEAEDILIKAIDNASNPEFKELADIYNIFGCVYYKQGQTKAALEAYQKSLGIAMKSKCLKRIKQAQKSIGDIQITVW